MHLVAAQKFFIKQITVKLYSNLFYFFAFTFMIKPSMLQVGANQHHFKIINCFDVITNDALCILCILNKIQFKFFMIMQWKIKLFLCTGKDGKTIIFCKRNYF